MKNFDTREFERLAEGAKLLDPEAWDWLVSSLHTKWILDAQDATVPGLTDFDRAFASGRPSGLEDYLTFVRDLRTGAWRNWPMLKEE